MKKESDKKNLVLVDDGAVHGITRWLPTLIVFCVVGGFFTLSWYAYHAGIESVKDEDLLVVEADKTPMKEKPTDPGGMQFPNQDKTIFDTFSGNKTPAQNVERILPSPEEPLSKNIDTSETSTWINNKLTDGKSGTEQVIGKKEAKKDKAEKPSSDHQVIPVSAPDDESETFVANHTPAAAANKILDNAVKESTKDKPPTAKEKAEAEKVMKEKVEADKAAAAKEAKEKAESEKAEAKATKEKEAAEKAASAKDAKEKADAEKAEAKTARDKEAAAAKEKAEADKAAAAKEAKEKAAEEKPVKKSSGNAAVQLGAYRSEEEATEAWEKMHLKHKDLSDKEPTIVRADLGAKGVYYRLRINNLDDAGAKSLCQTLTAKGQACIMPTGK